MPPFIAVSYCSCLDPGSKVPIFCNSEANPVILAWIDIGYRTPVHTALYPRGSNYTLAGWRSLSALCSWWGLTKNTALLHGYIAIQRVYWQGELSQIGWVEMHIFTVFFGGFDKGRLFPMVSLYGWGYLVPFVKIATMPAQAQGVTQLSLTRISCSIFKDCHNAGTGLAGHTLNAHRDIVFNLLRWPQFRRWFSGSHTYCSQRELCSTECTRCIVIQ